MRARVLAAGFFVVLGSISAPLAAAQESLVTFETNALTGSRTVTAAVAPEFPAITDLKVSSGDIATLTPASTTLTELFATGATWSVKAQMCGPDDYSDPTEADCTDRANQMIREDGGAAGAVAAADKLAGSTISLSRGVIGTVGAPAGTATAGAETNLGTQVTLMTSNDELASTTYNGVYTVTTGLTVNDLTRTGEWKGYWVITQTT